MTTISPGLPASILDSLPGRGEDFSRFWPAYMSARREHLAHVQAQLERCLSAGGTVWETLFGSELDPATGKPFPKAWSIPKAGFLEPFASDPARIAEHLANRYAGFGSTLRLEVTG